MALDQPERDTGGDEEEDRMVFASRGETYHTHGDQIRLTGRVISRVRELTGRLMSLDARRQHSSARRTSSPRAPRL